MTSEASSVQAYMAELPAERKLAITKLRTLCRRHRPSCKECMDHGGDKFREALPGANIGKGCIRFEVVGRLLRRTAESEEAPC